MDAGWKVIYYITASGQNPVMEFLNTHIVVKEKAIRILKHVEEYGLTSAIPHIKKLIGTPLWEVRILGQDSTRILFVTRTGNQFLLLHAFSKKTQKTPQREIKVALDRLKDWDLDN